MMNPKKHALALLFSLKSVRCDGLKDIQRAPRTGAVGVNWHDVAEEERVVPSDNE